MSKRKKTPKRISKRTFAQIATVQSRASSVPPPAESRAAEAVTIGWMLSMMATIFCLVVYAIVRAVIAFGSGVAGDGGAVGADAVMFYADLLLFTAMTVGIFSLLLVPIVFRLRRQKPPRGVTRVAITVGVLPVLLVIVRAIVR